MPSKKKTASESETAATPKPRARNTTSATKPLANAAEAAAPTAEKKKAAPKPRSAAATHKAPAKKSVKKEAAPEAAFNAEEHSEEIAREAYFMWMNRGGGHGDAHEDWLRAVEIVKSRKQTSPE